MFAEGPIPVPAGTPLRNEEIIDPSNLIVDAVFVNDRIDGLFDASEIILEATIVNPRIDSTLIPYYRFYYIDVELGVMTDLSLSF